MHRLNKQAYTNVIQLQLDIVFLFISYFVSYYIASKFTSLFNLTRLSTKNPKNLGITAS